MKRLHEFSIVAMFIIFIAESVVKERVYRSRQQRQQRQQRQHPDLQPPVEPHGFVSISDVVEYQHERVAMTEVQPSSSKKVSEHVQVKGAAVLPPSLSSANLSNVNRTTSRSPNVTKQTNRSRMHHVNKPREIHKQSFNKRMGINGKRRVLPMPTIQPNRWETMDNITRLSFILHRLIKTYNVTHVLDIWCMHGLVWLPDLVRKLEYEVPNFHYHCIVPTDSSLVTSLLSLEMFDSATVTKHIAPWAMKLPPTDLTILWHTVGFHPPHITWRIIQSLQNMHSRYVIVPNFPGSQHNTASGTLKGRVNVRRTPYRFNQPMRIINNMSQDKTIPKQLLLYDLRSIRSAHD